MSYAALPCASQPRAETQLRFQILFSLCLKTKGNQGLKERSRRLPEKKSYINAEKRKKKSLSRSICMLLYWSRFALQCARAELRAVGKFPLPRSPSASAFLSTSWSFTTWLFIISFLNLYTENHLDHFRTFKGQTFTRQTTSIKQFWPLCLRCATSFHLGLRLKALCPCIF